MEVVWLLSMLATSRGLYQETPGHPGSRFARRRPPGVRGAVGHGGGEGPDHGPYGSKGSDAYNDKLSKRRAASVKSWLSESGVTSSMVTEGKGERFPVAPNQTANGADNPEGRQQNRRVEFVIGED